MMSLLKVLLHARKREIKSIAKQEMEARKWRPGKWKPGNGGQETYHNDVLSGLEVDPVHISYLYQVLLY